VAFAPVKKEGMLAVADVDVDDVVSWEKRHDEPDLQEPWAMK